MHARSIYKCSLPTLVPRTGELPVRPCNMTVSRTMRPSEVRDQPPTLIHDRPVGPDPNEQTVPH